MSENKATKSDVTEQHIDTKKQHEQEVLIEDKNNVIEKISKIKLHPHLGDNIIEKQRTNDQEFWEGLIMLDINLLKPPIEYLLKEFGTKEPCNRFDVGNTIEFILSDCIKSCGFKVSELPNAKRFDLSIDNYKKLSIKYSSGGNITLHNSNSTINTDLEMKDTIILTPEKLYLITNEELKKYQININDYIENKGDSLKLKRKILKELIKKNYPFILEINIKHNKKECKNRLCSKTFYDKFKEEYYELHK